ncbi:hypothetical protein [Aliiroseovarius sp. YM-037]|uniref:hypothetical protein n=1 Tax=Aliiroseovarius sp. YM-037 TaxID=3341728 RepID=UPI003A809217
MKQISQSLNQLADSLKKSHTWNAATKTLPRLVFSMVVVFISAMAAMLGSLFLLLNTPLLGIVGGAVFVVLLLLLAILAREARRRENGE